MEASSGGTSIFTILFVVFLVLKLTHVITWSWWLVTLPLWGPLVLFIVIAAFMWVCGAFD